MKVQGAAIGFVALGIVTAAAPARADLLRGWMGQSLQETQHRVDVKLDGGVARLTVRRTVRNLGEIPEEANLDLTLPPGAVASGLRLRTGTGWENGTLMDSVDATDEYEELTGIGDHKVLRDPALLEWLDVGNLSLRVFPVPAGGEATVEYDLVMPTAYEKGWVVLYYPEPWGDESNNLIAPEVKLADATITRAAVLAADADTDAGEPDESPEDTENSRWTRIAFAPPKFDVMVARYGVFTVGQEQAIWRLEIDAAPELAPKPKKARVVFVVDASLSVGATGIVEQLALARGYMDDLPDAKYELVLFRRDATRLAGAFVSPDDLGKAITRAGSLDKLRPGNGSNLEAGLAAAADALAEGKHKGASRIVVLTDGFMRDGFSTSLAVALLQRAPKGTVVHVVKRPLGADTIFLENEAAAEPLAEERVDDDLLAPVASAYGGVVLSITGRGEHPRDYAELARGLVQPIRIDDFAVVSTGVDLHAMPRTLAAGSGVRHMVSVEGASGVVRVVGKIWAEPWTLDVPIDGAYSQKVGTLLFGDTVIHEVSSEDARRLAFAAKVVSPYTSYLAIEPGTQPSVHGVDRANRWGTIGSGDDAGTSGYGVGGGGSDGGELELLLEQMLAPGARGCGALDPEARDASAAAASIDIEATEQEIVDVRLREAPSAVIGTCLIEQAWELKLGEQYTRHITYKADVSVI